MPLVPLEYVRCTSRQSAKPRGLTAFLPSSGFHATLPSQPPNRTADSSIEDVNQPAESLKGKKAKTKKLKTEPADTKAKKLPKDVLKGLEDHFGIKLAKVRVHTGGNIKDICKELKASAFTIAQDIYFKTPAAAKDNKLLAHELTNVLQQSQGKMPKKAKPGTALISK